MASLESLAAVVAKIEAAADALGAAPITERNEEDGIVVRKKPENLNEELPETVKQYDATIDPLIQDFIDESNKMDKTAAKQAMLIVKVFDAHRRVLEIAPLSRKPGPKVLPRVFERTSEYINDVQTVCTDNEKHPLLPYFEVASEIAPTIGWITVTESDMWDGNPVAYIQETIDASKEFIKKIDSMEHQGWIDAMMGLFEGLKTYVGKTFPDGLKWGKKVRSMTFWSNVLAETAQGEAEAETYKYNTKLRSVVAVDIAPPKKVNLDGGVSGGLMSALNQGEHITTGLRKVRVDQMTHKNPELRTQSAILKDMARPAKRFVTLPEAKPTCTDPVLAKKSNKWKVEYQKEKHDIIIEDTNQKQTVYIGKCENCTIQIKGKVKSIAMDNCKKCGLVFDDVIAAAEIINSSGIKAQALGAVSTISIEKSDGVQVYLSTNSLTAEIVTAKCSELNISIPSDDTSENDFIELPVPEQFKSNYENKKLITVASDIC